MLTHIQMQIQGTSTKLKKEETFVDNSLFSKIIGCKI